MLAPAFISFLVCLTSPRFAAMCSGVSPRSLRLFTFLSAGVRFVDVTDGGGEEGFGEESENSEVPLSRICVACMHILTNSRKCQNHKTDTWKLLHSDSYSHTSNLGQRLIKKLSTTMDLISLQRYHKSLQY